MLQPTPVEQAILSLRETDYSRNLRYQRNWRYYQNIPYSQPRPGLYAKMRAIFNQITKIVDTDARFAMGERLQVHAEPDVEAAVNRLWEWSGFQQEKFLLARYGSCCGDAFIKVVDNRPWELNPDPDPKVPVRLNVLPPDAVSPRYDPHDRSRLLACKIEYIHGRDIHKEVITPEEILLYDERDPDRVAARYPNPLGFIPIVHIRNLDIGEEFGLCSFHNLLPTVDALNEIASFMLEIVKLYADPVIVGRGMERGSLRKQTVDADGRPVATVWWVPTPEGQFEFLEWRGNLPDVLAFLDRIQASVERNTPELTLSGLRDRQDVSGYSISLHLIELVRKIDEMRGNYFTGLERANRMALQILELQGKGEFPDPSHRIVADPVLPVDDERQLRILQMENQVLRIKSRATVAAERGIEEVESELKQADADAPNAGAARNRHHLD
ncbi:MAG: phage portal protein [Proteobacteria bacterium]|nr:phage portal protein [Pseudomonadota bacterium]